MAGLMWMGAAMGVALVVLLVLSGGFLAVAHQLGFQVGREVTATVVKKSYHDVVPIGRGNHCDFYKFTVAWDDKEGTFDSCAHRPLSDLRMGDEVRVLTVPGSSEVNPQGEPYVFWGVAGTLAALFALIGGVRCALRYRRMGRKGAPYPVLVGRIVSMTQSSMTVQPEVSEADQRPLVMLPSKRHKLNLGERVHVWSARRVRGRPRGPWAVRGYGNPELYTHAWRKRRVRR